MAIAPIRRRGGSVLPSEGGQQLRSLDNAALTMPSTGITKSSASPRGHHQAHIACSREESRPRVRALERHVRKGAHGRIVAASFELVNVLACNPGGFASSAPSGEEIAASRPTASGTPSPPYTPPGCGPGVRRRSSPGLGRPSWTGRRQRRCSPARSGHRRPPPDTLRHPA